MPECLAGCTENYKCGELQLPGPAGQQAESFAPWVWAQIGAGEKITVGNESYSPSPNTACIKTFEVGWMTEPSIVLEILDEAGGRMGAILDSVRKCINDSVGRGTSMTFQFGWIINTCEGQKQVIPSQIFETQIMKLEVNYSEGKIKYKIHGRALSPVVEGMREDDTRGEDDKKINLETAIRNICALPPAINVRFMKVQADGKAVDTKFNWYGFPEGGPLGFWQGDNQNRPAVIAKWVEPYRINDGTIEGAGIIVNWTPTKYNEMVIWQDPTKAKVECTDQHLGTYIVNGGKCSPVIEFSPTYDWMSAAQTFIAGGGTSGPGNTTNHNDKEVKVAGQDKDHGATAGLQQQLTITQQSWDAYGPKNAWVETMKSQRAHVRAGKMTLTRTNAIEADLKILGDPRPGLCDHPGAKLVSIVAINPFHLRGDMNCGIWVAEPGCNQIMSNKDWKVVGINHAIQAGSYTTTLKLHLQVSGMDIDKYEPIGGEGSEGATVKNTCP